MEEPKDQRLQALFDACFYERPHIASEARHLARFFQEYRLLRHSQEQDSQYAAELTEAAHFRAEFGQLHLFSGEFEHSDIDSFVRKMVGEFLSRPEERVELVRVLKQAGSVEGIQQEVAGFLRQNWKLDEAATDGALDMIWDIEILSQLEETLQKIVRSAATAALQDHACQRLGILASVREAQ